MKVMGFHEGSVPPGWVQLSAGNNRFLRGSSSAGGVGGSATHTHSADFPSTTSGGAGVVNTENVYTDLAYMSHTHLAPAANGLTSEAGSSLPLYNDVRLIYFEESFDEV